MELQAPSKRNRHPGPLAPALAWPTLQAVQCWKLTLPAWTGKRAKSKAQSWKTPTKPTSPGCHIASPLGQQFQRWVWGSWLESALTCRISTSCHYLSTSVFFPHSLLFQVNSNVEIASPQSWKLHQKMVILRLLMRVSCQDLSGSDLTRYSKKPQLFSYPWAATSVL